tara:strand:- start:8159 stop:8971 length:813 start_codon:yes stop_codon:yes gene_type:complete
MAGHWYNKEGEPCHDATMKEVRKYKLLPSVTSILGIIDKGPWLSEWKVNQAIYKTKSILEELSKIDNLKEVEGYTPKKGIDEEKIKSMVKEALSNEREVTLELGEGVHRLCEAYLGNDQNLFEVEKTKANAFQVYLNSKIEEKLEKYKNQEDGYTEEIVVSSLGYAGRVDYFWLDDSIHIRDFKTQNVKKQPNFYTDWIPQLMAYSYAIHDKDFFEPEKVDAGSIIISTNEINKGSHEKIWSNKSKIKGWRIFINAFNLWKTVYDYDPIV